MLLVVLINVQTPPRQDPFHFSESFHALTLCNDLSLRLGRPRPKDSTSYPHLPTAHCNSPLKVLTHSHAQLQVPLQPQLLDHQIPLLPQRNKILILRSSSHTPCNGTNSHQPQQLQMLTLRLNSPTQLHRLLARCAARLGRLARRVHLYVHVELGDRGIYGSRRNGVAAVLVQQGRLLERVDAGDDKEVRDARQGLAVRRLQAADEVPVDRPRQDFGLLGEFLGVVLAEVGVGRFALVNSEDVICWLELGDGD